MALVRGDGGEKSKDIIDAHPSQQLCSRRRAQRRRAGYSRFNNERAATVALRCGGASHPQWLVPGLTPKCTRADTSGAPTHWLSDVKIATDPLRGAPSYK